MPTEDLYTAYTMDWWEALAASCDSDGLMTPPDTAGHPCRDKLLSYGGGSPGVGPCRPPPIGCTRDQHCAEGVFCVRNCEDNVLRTDSPRSLFLQSSTSLVFRDDAILVAPWNLFFFHLPGVDKIIDDPSQSEFDSEVAFINAAFNLLLDNLDIVEYVICMLAGSDVADCVVNDLRTEEQIRFDSVPSAFRDLEDCMWVTGLNDGIVRLDFNCPEFSDLLKSFLTTDPNEKLCAAAQLAAQLLAQFTRDWGCPALVDTECQAVA